MQELTNLTIDELYEKIRTRCELIDAYMSLLEMHMNNLHESLDLEGAFEIMNVNATNMLRLRYEVDELYRELSSRL
jgi:hypothetical protein